MLKPISDAIVFGTEGKRTFKMPRPQGGQYVVTVNGIPDDDKGESLVKKLASTTYGATCKVPDAGELVEQKNKVKDRDGHLIAAYVAACAGVEYVAPAPPPAKPTIPPDLKATDPPAKPKRTKKTKTAAAPVELPQRESLNGVGANGTAHAS